MGKASYTGVSGVSRKNKKIYVGVNGVAKKIAKGYVGVAGIARKWFPSFPIIQFLTGDASNGNATNMTLNSYQADNGNFILRVKCTNANWSNSRAYALVNIIDEFVEGDTVTLKWSTGNTNTQYDDKKLCFFDESNKHLVDSSTNGIILSTSTSGTYTHKVPKGTHRIQVILSLGAQGNRDTTWTITQLTVGKVTYTIKGD